MDNMPTQSQESQVTEDWKSPLPTITQHKKGKGGRPRLLDAELRNCHYHNGYTIAEARQIKAAAEKAGLSETDYVRYCVLNRQLICVPSINKQTYSELGRIGQNVNGIAVRMNINERPSDEILKHSMQALITQLSAIRKELLGVQS